MSDSMERILTKAFANLLTDVADVTKTHPALIEDYKKFFKTGKYALATADPMKIKVVEKQAQDAKKRISSVLKITIEGVDKPTVVAKATDSFLLLSKLKLELESLKEKADSEAERGDKAQKQRVKLNRELALLKEKKSRETSLKNKTVDGNVANNTDRRVAELNVEIALNDSEIQAAGSEEENAKKHISTTNTRLLAVQEESSKGDTSKTTPASRPTTSRRNSGTVFLLLSNEIVFLMLVGEYFGVK